MSERQIDGSRAHGIAGLTRADSFAIEDGCW